MATRVAPKQPQRTRRTRAERQPAHDSIQKQLQILQSLELPSEDGDRMESDWHVVSISLMDELVRQHLGDPVNYFCSGNMFIYFSLEQAKEIVSYVHAEKVARKPRFKGPDFFLVKGVDGTRRRESWVVWNEDGRYPDVIVEFISSSTRKKDVDKNVRFYRDVFRTPEYFWYDERKDELKGYRLSDGRYVEITPNEQGWLWSEQLEAYLGVWEGVYRGRYARWLRLYTREGELVPTADERAGREARRAEVATERAEQEAQRAEFEAQRANRAEAELQRLRQILQEQGIELD